MSALNMDRTAEPVGEAASDQGLVLTELSEAARTLALSHWRVLRPHLEDGVPLARAARDAGVSLRTTQHWLMSFRADGLAGLARRQRVDRGRRCIPHELVAVIEGLALRRPAPTIATVDRRAVEVAERERSSLPSYATVYAVIRAIEPGVVTLAHEGDKRYRETRDLIYRREAAVRTPPTTGQSHNLDFEALVFAEHLASRDDAELAVRLEGVGDELARAREEYLHSRGRTDALVAAQEAA